MNKVIKSGLCLCGCGMRPTIAKTSRKSTGMVAGQPNSFVKGHKGKSPADRFWSKVAKGDKEDCWEWIVAINSSGYGSFGYNGKVYSSSRFSWFLSSGKFPEDCVLHKCDNRKCVNPEHLFIGSAKDNSDDKINKGRWRGHNIRGDLHWNTIIPVGDFASIFSRHKSGESIRSIARSYDVAMETVRKIIIGDRAE